MGFLMITLPKTTPAQTYATQCIMRNTYKKSCRTSLIESEEMLETIKLPCTEKHCNQAWNGKFYHFDRALKKFCAKKEHQRIEKGMCNRKYGDRQKRGFTSF